MRTVRAALLLVSRIAAAIAFLLGLAAVLGVPAPGSWATAILQLGLAPAAAELLHPSPNWPAALVALASAPAGLLYVLRYGPHNPGREGIPPECEPALEQTLLWMRVMCATVLATFGVVLVRSG